MKLNETSLSASQNHIEHFTAKNLRVVIENFTPSINGGRFTPKCLVNEKITIEADIYVDSHLTLQANLHYRQKGSGEWKVTPMRLINNDRWSAAITFNQVGLFELKIEAWVDHFAFFIQSLHKKVDARVDVSLEIQEGFLLLKQTLENVPLRAKTQDFKRLKALLKAYIDAGKKKRNLQTDSIDSNLKVADLSSFYGERTAAALALFFSDETQTLHESVCQKEFVTSSQVFPIRVETTRAEFSSWYEMFPRSQSGDVNRHGTWGDVMARIPSISEMGFDTLYFTPIHPIGSTFRKGKNNSLTPDENDPGSPYAIGSKDGGHEALHPQIGSWQDFRTMRDAAKSYDIDIAIDFAIQCSPDHPWLSEHPEWFNWRPDGSIRHAENPPKKYQDIVNVDFYATNAIPALWVAWKDIVLLWANEGVRTFRVDNPHTKPFPFWEWLIAEVQAIYPDTIFLSEAFTHPKIMARLAKLGFTQSYTYFTWRNTKYELTEYLTELNREADYLRPHFFVNTPDINPFYLQQNGRNGFLVRAALAATTSGLWGISSGFELCEADALEGKEEFNHSEKYEIRVWDWNRLGNIIKEISILNSLRKNYPSLQTQRGIDFHPSSNEQVILYSKKGKYISNELLANEPLDSLILVAVNLSANALQDTQLEIPLYMLGLNDHAGFDVHDLVSDTHFTLYGKWQSLRLDPAEFVFVIWEIKALH